MGKAVKQIALYGKGGIGKSTLACNLSVALMEMGVKVMQVGCSPKSDSVTFLNGGKPLETSILEVTREKGNDEDTILGTVVKDKRGIYLVEAGGPEPAEGCAGRGISVALDLLKQYTIPEKLGVDLIIYDVIGDVVCGGFAQPMRSGYAREIYLITCGEPLTLFQVNNIIKAVYKLSGMGADVGIAAIINNMRGVSREEEIVEEFGSLVGVPVIEHIPRSKIVQDAEMQGKTVIEAFPESDQANIYRRLAKKNLENQTVHIPKPITMEDIKKILLRVFS